MRSDWASRGDLGNGGRPLSLLGTPPATLPDPRACAAPQVRSSSRVKFCEVVDHRRVPSPPCRRRRRRIPGRRSGSPRGCLTLPPSMRIRRAPQRDLDRGEWCRSSARQGPAMRWCSSTRPRPPAASPSTSAEADAYYFAPQKGFGSDGGLWLAPSPACARADRGARRRRGPLAASLAVAADRPRKLAQGTDVQHARAWRPCPCSPTRSIGCSARAGSSGASGARGASSDHLYGWAEASDLAGPFVADTAKRSPVVGTIDFDEAHRRGRPGGHAAGERHRGHRALPQARAQLSCGSGCSRRSIPPTSRHSPPASTGSFSTSRRPRRDAQSDRTKRNPAAVEAATVSAVERTPSSRCPASS